MTKLQHPARERLESGALAIGVGVRLARTVEIAKLMKSAGFDWLFIDLEHGSLSLETATQICIAALDVGISPIVRVPNGEFSLATRALDNGALGIVIPHVESADEARLIVEKLKYPPQGHRSVAGSGPQFDYLPRNVGETSQILNAANLTIVMLETPRAIENAEAIAAVTGIDVLLIGTNDLCTEMGIPGDFGNERVPEAYKRVIAACEKHGKWPGMGGVYDEKLLERYIALGQKMVLCGADLTFVLGAAKNRAGFVRGLERKPVTV